MSPWILKLTFPRRKIAFLGNGKKQVLPGNILTGINGARITSHFSTAPSPQIIPWEFIMPGEEHIKISGKDLKICRGIGKGSKTALIARDFGLRLRLKRNLALKIKKILKNSVSPSLSNFAATVLRNIRIFKPNKVNA